MYFLWSVVPKRCTCRQGKCIGTDGNWRRAVEKNECRFVKLRVFQVFKFFCDVFSEKSKNIINRSNRIISITAVHEPYNCFYYDFPYKALRLEYKLIFLKHFSREPKNSFHLIREHYSAIGAICRPQ